MNYRTSSGNPQQDEEIRRKLAEGKEALCNYLDEIWEKIEAAKEAEENDEYGDCSACEFECCEDCPDSCPFIDDETDECCGSLDGYEMLIGEYAAARKHRKIVRNVLIAAGIAVTAVTAGVICHMKKDKRPAKIFRRRS